MIRSNWLYIAVMFAVSYTIRILPLTLIRKPIKNRFIQSFLYYVPYVTLAVMTFPGHRQRHPESGSWRGGAGGRHCSGMVRSQPVSGIGGLLRRRLRAGTVPCSLR